MKFFDLFAGIGGFRLGLEANGHKCIGSCEIDKYARKIYAKNFGSEPEYKDARDINTTELPDFDILSAGFPCQSFSIVGNRQGLEDTRGTLVYEIFRIAREKQPSILLLENVKGLLSHDKGKTFEVIIQSLDEMGYDCEWQLINSKYFVPQNRDRIFIIGHLRWSSSRKILPLGQFNPVNVKPREQLYATDECSSTLTATYWKGYGGGRPMIAEPKIKVLSNSDRDTYRIYSTDGVARTLRAGVGGLGKMTGVYKTSDYHYRKLTPTECERLQGFPDGFTSGVSDTQRYKMLGNAVTVTVIKSIAEKFKLEESK